MAATEGPSSLLVTLLAGVRGKFGEMAVAGSFAAAAGVGVGRRRTGEEVRDLLKAGARRGLLVAEAVVEGDGTEAARWGVE